ncbi:hypothetical protein TNCV_1113641 [Trichonephila clavipes]|nr:hypothetical protein TNCV_1113641 [Trichonephila clavipes]
MTQHSSAVSHHGVAKLESDHCDGTNKSGIRQLTEWRSIPFSMSAVHHTIGDANDNGFQSKLNEAMNTLWTFHSAADGVEWYG